MINIADALFAGSGICLVLGLLGILDENCGLFHRFTEKLIDLTLFYCENDEEDLSGGKN